MKTWNTLRVAGLATLVLVAGTAAAAPPGNGGLGNHAPRRLSSDYTPTPIGEYRPMPIGEYRPAPALGMPRNLRGVADAEPPKLGKTPADPPAPKAPKEVAPDPLDAAPPAPLGPPITVEGVGPAPGGSPISPGPSPDNGANPYPAFYPRPLVGKKAEMAEAATYNRGNEPGWYKDWRCRQWGYYPTQWRAWPTGWHEGRNLQPGPHPYDISPPELPDPPEDNEPLPPRSRKLPPKRDAEKKKSEAGEPAPLPPRASSSKEGAGLDRLRDVPKK